MHGRDRFHGRAVFRDRGIPDGPMAGRDETGCAVERRERGRGGNRGRRTGSGALQGFAGGRSLTMISFSPGRISPSSRRATSSIAAGSSFRRRTVSRSRAFSSRCRSMVEESSSYCCRARSMASNPLSPTRPSTTMREATNTSSQRTTRRLCSG